MKKILLIFGFLFIALFSFGEELLFSSNGTLQLGFDTRFCEIKEVYKGLNSSKAVVKSIALGVEINNKLYNFKDLKPKITYMNGTNIIKMESSFNSQLKFETYIYTSKEIDKSTFFVENKVKTGDVRNSKELKFYYHIDTKYKRSTVEISQSVSSSTEENLNAISLINRAKFYLASDESLSNKRVKKISSSLKKETGDKQLIITEFGKISSYEDEKDIVAFSFGEISDELIESDAESLLSYELNSWSVWQDEMLLENFTETEKNVIIQSLVLLKGLQAEDGAIYNSYKLGKREIKTREMLAGIEAFIKAGYYKEAKLSLEYLLKAKTGKLAKQANFDYLISHYAYEAKTGEEITKEEQISFYNTAYFLYVFSEYLGKSGDVSLLKTNFVKLTNKVADFLYRNIENGLIKADFYDEKNKRAYLNTQYMTFKALNKFANEINFFAPKSLIKRYKNIALEVQKKSNKVLVKDFLLIDSIEKKSNKLRNVEALNDEFIKDDEVIKKTLNYYIKKDNLGDVSNYISLIDTMYKNDFINEADKLKRNLEKYIKNNSYIIPEYIKVRSGVTKYGTKGISAELCSKYILLAYSRRENGFNK